MSSKQFLARGEGASRTRPELRLEQALKQAGLNFVTQSRPLANRRIVADLLFRDDRVAVFVDGCFWHGCPEHCPIPRSNIGYWGLRAESARVRDAAIVSALEAEGWTAVRIWEHEHVLDGVNMVVHALESANQRSDAG